MALVVADTDVLIDFLAGVDPVAKEISGLLQEGRLTTTVISRFELMAGAKTHSQQKIAHDLLDLLPTFALDSQATDRAAMIQRTLEAQGSPIGMADSLIAGITLIHDARLFTRNRKHFDRVSDLKLFGI